MKQKYSQFSSEIDENITDITSIWDELTNRSTELEHLLSCGKEDHSFERSRDVIDGCVDGIEAMLVDERVPSDLVAAENLLSEHMVCII